MPCYEVRCQSCDKQYERIRTIADRNDPCDQCGGEIEQVFRASFQGKGFEPYFDQGLGVWVAGQGDIKQAMRRAKADYREPMRPGDQSARKDRIAEMKRGGRRVHV
jgi:putative FmdB family regulatory protein